MIHFCQDEANAIMAVWNSLIGNGGVLKVATKNAYNKIKCVCASNRVKPGHAGGKEYTIKRKESIPKDRVTALEE